MSVGAHCSDLSLTQMSLLYCPPNKVRAINEDFLQVQGRYMMTSTLFLSSRETYRLSFLTMHRSSSSLVLLSTLLVCVLQACQAAERGDSAALDFNSDRYRLQFELEETYNMVPGSGNGGWDAGPVLDRKNTILSFDDACTTYHHAVDVLGKMITAAAVPDSGSGAVGAARHVQSKKRETDNHKLYDRYRQYASWWLNLKNEKADSYVIGLREAQSRSLLCTVPALPSLC